MVDVNNRIFSSVPVKLLLTSVAAEFRTEASENPTQRVLCLRLLGYN